MKQRILELRQIYRWGSEILAEAGVEDYELDAWYLLEYVTGISKASYLADPNRLLTEEQVELYESYVQKRASRIPLQHITGEQEFMGYSFYVNEHVLIPRQDTEVLVEEALKLVRPGIRILDMCTGSGCILLSLLKMSRERYCLNTLSGVGADVSEEALEVAEKNRERLGVDALFLQSDLFAQVEGTYDMILSNPPYIRTSVIEGLQVEVRLHDPYIALDGKEDGLFFYRRIIQEGTSYLNPGGYLLFEIGHDQGEDVSDLMREAGYQHITIKKDLAGLDRVVSGQKI
jgi:release factor glutamine methyltransferase